MSNASITKSASKDSSESSDSTLCVDEGKKRLTPEERAIRKALLDRAYHLPGNDYYQDLYQYLTNNHPLVGIFVHNRLHPVGTGMRVVAFFGSIIFGLAITNIIYMAFIFEGQQFNKALVNVTITDQEITGNAAVDQQLSQIDVTSGMIALWTVGAALNGLYDNLIWAVSACTCCLEGGRYEHLQKYRKYIPFIVMFLVVGTAALASLAVVIVASSRSTTSDEQTAKLLGISYNSNIESYRFLLAYGIEVALSLAVWYPLTGALLFSGVMGCGKVPIIGGRPYEMRMLEKNEMADQPIEEGQEVKLTTSGQIKLDSVV